jgi:hypothetical protein
MTLLTLVSATNFQTSQTSNDRNFVISGFRRNFYEICVFCDITQRRVVILYRRFGTTYQSHLQGPRS